MKNLTVVTIALMMAAFISSCNKTEEKVEAIFTHSMEDLKEARLTGFNIAFDSQVFRKLIQDTNIVLMSMFEHANDTIKVGFTIVNLKTKESIQATRYLVSKEEILTITGGHDAEHLENWFARDKWEKHQPLFLFTGHEGEDFIVRLFIISKDPIKLQYTGKTKSGTPGHVKTITLGKDEIPEEFLQIIDQAEQCLPQPKI